MGFSALAQEKRISGRVIDDFGVSIRDVTITINGQESRIKTDCKGQFKFEALVGDTLVLSKNGFIDYVEIVKENRNKRYKLNFNYQAAIAKLDKNSEENGPYPAGCQPLVVLDWLIATPELMDLIQPLEKEDIKTTKVIKGWAATTLFGKSARNGIIFLFTRCTVTYPW